MNIAVYSGSFNPLHIGHLAIMKYLIGEGGFDCVYLIVSPKNPLKEGIDSASGQDRFEAAVEAVKRHFPDPLSAGDIPSTTYSPADKGRRVKVDDIELNMPAPHYTIRTLDALREREPDNCFTLVMGADNLADIRRWRDYRRILKEYGVAVYPRKGFDLAAIKEDLLTEDPAYRITIMNAEMVDISSTIIRNAIAAGQDMSQWLM
ncbi:MAG: nicotinate-nicotinamide nucleotide adenylyltransferase [Bacteroidales bacterium]|nr:nicotinate-nicotinamide nucleotide adenylyltransferase [Bacteroidales bacterium]